MTKASTRGPGQDQDPQQRQEAALQQAIRLPAHPISARRARHHVRRELIRAGRPQWADDAALAVSELVANAVLHARTDCEVLVCVSRDAARIGVRDYSPTLPVARHASQDATTGRGLPLVAALSASHGVEASGSHGKVVWFLLTD